jgi:hypothetical protein
MPETSTLPDMPDVAGRGVDGDAPHSDADPDGVTVIHDIGAEAHMP